MNKTNPTSPRLPTKHVNETGAADKKKKRQRRKKPKVEGAASIKPVTTTLPPAPTPYADVKAAAAAPKNRNQFSDVPFTTLTAVGATLQRGLKEILKYEYMTKVQDMTLPPIMDGKDVLAKAKTGSGKTTAFLLPMLARIASNMTCQGIQAVILSPTRELTMQIAAEAKALVTFVPGIKIVSLIGGTKMGKDIKSLSSTVHCIVATPGRFQDHLKNNTEKMVDRLQFMNFFCLDEADRLLDMGFRNDLQRIIGFLPTTRQTLLFSATLPSELTAMTKLAMRKDYQYINCISKGEDNTNVQVTQEFAIVPLADHIATLETLIKRHQVERAASGYKIMVFFNTARTTGYMSTIFLKANFPVLEMHSRKSQSYRTKVAGQFTSQQNVMMFSSDVSARGVDYPGVTLIVQVGLTTKEQYIHRLGRTARAGQAGKGILLLSPFEQAFISELKDLKITELSPVSIENTATAGILATVSSSSDLKNQATMAYQAFLGFYNSNLKQLKMNKPTAISIANEYVKVLGCMEQPFLSAKVVGKMGLKGQPGLRIKKGN